MDRSIFFPLKIALIAAPPIFSCLHVYLAAPSRKACRRLGVLLADDTGARRAGSRASIKLIGRWHDLVRGRGVAVYESDSAEAVSNWGLNWNNILDLEISPVLDDEETRELGKKRLGKKRLKRTRS